MEFQLFEKKKISNYLFIFSLSAELVDDEEPEDALIEDNKPIENPSGPPFNPSTTRSTTRRPIPAIATTFR